MFNKLTTITLLSLSSLVMSSQVSATLILENYSSGTATPETIGGYTMTDFAFIDNAIAVDSVAAPGGGSLDFSDKYGDPVTMVHSTADSTDWWVNGESSDYDIYTTGLHLVTLTLPEDTLAFSFNVGASLSGTGNNAWLTATEISGSGIAKQWFNVNYSNTPGFGIYADNSSSDCAYLSSVTIDPLQWGFGNFSISQGSCTTVPEPSILLLMSTGFIVVSLLARRKRLFK